MYWTLELASYLSDAPWPANKDELSCRKPTIHRRRRRNIRINGRNMAGLSHRRRLSLERG
jgi:hypothetical protein